MSDDEKKAYADKVAPRLAAMDEEGGAPAAVGAAGPAAAEDDSSEDEDEDDEEDEEEEEDSSSEEEEPPKKAPPPPVSTARLRAAGFALQGVHAASRRCTAFPHSGLARPQPATWQAAAGQPGSAPKLLHGCCAALAALLCPVLPVCLSRARDGRVHASGQARTTCSQSSAVLTPPTHPSSSGPQVETHKKKKHKSKH